MDEISCSFILRYDGLEATKGSLGGTDGIRATEAATRFFAHQGYFLTHGCVPERFKDSISNRYKVEFGGVQSGCVNLYFTLAVTTLVSPFIAPLITDLGHSFKDSVKQGGKALCNYVLTNFNDILENRPPKPLPYNERLEPFLEFPDRVNMPVFDDSPKRFAESHLSLKKCNKLVQKMGAPLGRSAESFEIITDFGRSNRVCHEDMIRLTEYEHEIENNRRKIIYELGQLA